jgi:acetyl esterase/lipase
MDAIKYVRDNAARLGVDPDRIALWAVSPGGIFLIQPLRDHPSYLRAIVGYYVEMDLRNSRQAAPASVTDETLRDYSPAYQLERDGKNLPPMFIARAGLDDPGLNSGLDRFVDLALKNNAYELINHPTGHHGFDIEDNNPRSREIMKRTIEFIKTQTAK